MLSTPTVEGDNLTKEMERCGAVYDWHVPCPKCGAFQPLRFRPTKYRTVSGGEAISGCLSWESLETPQESAKTARYKCGECGGEWTTAEKNSAVTLGCASPRTTTAGKCRRVGFHISRLYSFFDGGRLSELVESFLLAKEDQSELQSFVNNSLAEHWIQRVSAPQDEAQASVMACRSDIPRGVVPEESVGLTCGVDNQMDGYWYRIRAFAPDKTSWGIDEGFVATDEMLEEILFNMTWRTPTGRVMKIWRALIDTGGGKDDAALVSRTEEVYEFLRRNKRRGVQLLGSKGSSWSMPSKIKIGKPIEKMPSGKPISGGVQIVMVNTDVMKDELWDRIQRTLKMVSPSEEIANNIPQKREPGAWWLHAETPEWVVRQITAEEKRIEKGVSEWAPIRKDNHLLDCECLCLAAADPEFWGGVRVLRRSPYGAPTPRPTIQIKENPYLTTEFEGENPYIQR